MKHLIFFTFASTLAASAELIVPKIFSDGMILQRDSSAAVWGWATPKAEIAVSFAGQELKAKANPDGRWQVSLEGLKASSKAQTLTITGDDTTKTINDVLVGEVWLASGQSNMEWTVVNSGGAQEEIAENRDPQLRVFVSQNITAIAPATDWNGSWQATQPENTGKFTAIGYYFAKRLRAELGVPVGVIECAWGGKPVQSFTSEEALATLPIGQKLLDRKNQAAAGFDPAKTEADFQKRRAAFQKNLADWEANKDEKKGNKPRPPQKQDDPRLNSSMPATIYHGMIAPIVGYGARGAIWYQGESNASGETATEYEELLGTLVKDWRQRWGHDLSFYWVQLANFRAPSTEPGNESGWVTVQDEMRRALKSIPKGGMAVINDIGDAKNIHPSNKVDVSERLARWALAQDYGREGIVVSGPLYSGVEKKDNTLVISFDHAKGLKSRDGKPLARFEIMDSDGKWHWAQAKIVGETVVVSHKDLTNPKHARYAWAENPEGANLVNGEGLPTSCFTTEY